jgi:excisionase family DNA binding protein
MTTETGSPWMTTKDAAAYLGVGPKAIYRAIEQGALRATRINGRREIRTRREWLDQFMEKQASD